MLNILRHQEAKFPQEQTMLVENVNTFYLQKVEEKMHTLSLLH